MRIVFTDLTSRHSETEPFFGERWCSTGLSPSLCPVRTGPNVPWEPHCCERRSTSCHSYLFMARTKQTARKGNRPPKQPLVAHSDQLGARAPVLGGNMPSKIEVKKSVAAVLLSSFPSSFPHHCHACVTDQCTAPCVLSLASTLPLHTHTHTQTHTRTRTHTHTSVDQPTDQSQWLSDPPAHPTPAPAVAKFSDAMLRAASSILSGPYCFATTVHHPLTLAPLDDNALLACRRCPRSCRLGGAR